MVEHLLPCWIETLPHLEVTLFGEINHFLSGRQLAASLLELYGRVLGAKLGLEGLLSGIIVRPGLVHASPELLGEAVQLRDGLVQDLTESSPGTLEENDRNRLKQCDDDDDDDDIISDDYNDNLARD